MAIQSSIYRGRMISPEGYVRLTVSTDPYRYVYEHRVVAAAILGRPLTGDEIVHHLDGDKQNNTPANLAIMAQADHCRMHMTNHQWSRSYAACRHCGTTARKHQARGLCKPCYRAAGHLYKPDQGKNSR